MNNVDYFDEDYESFDSYCYQDDNDYESDTFYALTDGMYGDYEDWQERGDIDMLMESLGY